MLSDRPMKLPDVKVMVSFKAVIKVKTLCYLYKTNTQTKLQFILFKM